MEFTNTTKFLVLDGENIMRWDKDQNMYLQVSGDTITPELIKTHGSTILPTVTTGLASRAPKVFAFDTQENAVVPTNINFGVLPDMQLVKMLSPMMFSAGYIQGLKNVKYNGSVPLDALLRFIVSPDGGKKWYTYDTSWHPINCAVDEVSAKGINHDALTTITAEAWSGLFTTKSITFAWVMQIPNTEAKLILESIELTYTIK